MVEWVEPALPTNQPQTPALEEVGKTRGRPLPLPEILPADARPLRCRFSFRARAACCAGASKAAAPTYSPGWCGYGSSVSTGYCPNVRIEISPPFAGSLGAKELVKQTWISCSSHASSSPMTSRSSRRNSGYAPWSVPVSAGSWRHFGFLDAIGFFVNKDNPLERITFQQLDSILSSTHHRGGAPITVWGAARSDRRLGGQTHSRLCREALERIRGVHTAACAEHLGSTRRVAHGPDFDRLIFPVRDTSRKTGMHWDTPDWPSSTPP